MSTEGDYYLETMVREVKEESAALIASFEELKTAGQPVHQVILATGKIFATLLELVMRINATLFEARPDDEERKLRLELDDAFRLQLNTIRELLKILPREGS